MDGAVLVLTRRARIVWAPATSMEAARRMCCRIPPLAHQHVILDTRSPQCRIKDIHLDEQIMKYPVVIRPVFSLGAAF